MKSVTLLSTIVVIFFSTIISRAQESPDGKFYSNKNGNRCFIFRKFPGDLTLKIPIDSCAEYTPYAWGNGQHTEKGIAVSVQILDKNIGAQRYFIPFLLTKDTLYVVIERGIKEKIHLNALCFKDYIPNPARIELWYDDRLIGDLPPVRFKPNQNGIFIDYIELFSIVTGFNTLSGDQVINNLIICEKICELFQPLGPDKFTSKFPFEGREQWGKLY